ncbi:MAG TPA: type II toxin-antitoxin system HicB family antitoxin [Thermomicrobiales bacterium]|jgi:predicted RNase H-like HicB family nuclease
MTRATRLHLDDYLRLAYPLSVIPDPDGGYVIDYPDLPGCMGQVEDLAEVGAEAEEIRRLWLTVSYEQGLEIPLPSHRGEYSGKFNLRLPRSLHRSLAQAAEHEGVSLNQYAATILARGDALARVERRFDDLSCQLDAIHQRLRYQMPELPQGPKKADLQLVVAVAA